MSESNPTTKEFSFNIAGQRVSDVTVQSPYQTGQIECMCFWRKG